MKNRTIVIFVAVVVLLDQLTKWVVQNRIALYDSIPVTSFFSLTHVTNTGAAFGLFTGANTFFVIITILILTLLVFYHRRLLGRTRLTSAGLSLVAGGALGNLIDRFARGHVVDFLDVYWRRWHWPAFNVADSAISVGIFFLVIASFTNTENRLQGPSEPADPRITTRSPGSL